MSAVERIEAHMASTPEVGIFWLIDNKLVADSIPWRPADVYGGFCSGKIDQASMIGDSRPLRVLVNGGTAVSAKAVSLGLIVSGLVINALKHAFQDGQVVVSYKIDGPDWKLVVSDNGIGKPDIVALR